MNLPPEMVVAALRAHLRVRKAKLASAKAAAQAARLHEQESSKDAAAADVPGKGKLQDSPSMPQGRGRPIPADKRHPVTGRFVSLHQALHRMGSK